MNAPVAWVFPGQGAQHRGMGEELFSAYPAECALAQRILGFSVPALCRDPGDRLRRTEFAQPALFLVEALAFQARLEQDRPPDLLAGHSLGELTALWAAGCFDLETGLRLVRRRGELMAEASGGQMVAVLGVGAGRIAELIARTGADEVDVANHNSPRQVVLAAPAGALEPVLAALREEPGARTVPLAVSAAFHSRAMREPARRFGELLAGAAPAPPRIPVIANVTGLPYPPDGVAELLARQIDSPVRWQACQRYLSDHGVEEVVELGPGRVLTGLWRSRDEDAATVRAVRAPAPAPAPARRPEPAPPRQPARLAPVEEAARELGSAAFREDYGIRYAYLAGSMYRGVASVDLVTRLADHGLLGFFGAGGLELEAVAEALRALETRLGRRGRFGLNLLYPHDDPALERATVELYLRHDVGFVEAAAYTQLTPALVRLRYRGARQRPDGRLVPGRRVVAKVSRPEVAAAFLRPPPSALLEGLVRAGDLTPAEADVAGRLPACDDLCVEADSGGHTDAGVLLVLLPAMVRLRNEIAARERYPVPVRVGAAGGLGTGEAVAAAFALGAEFVVTGSVNQCSPEAGTSTAVKDLLATVGVQDTGYAPAGDLFELGGQVQVVRRGTLFAARARKLLELYRTHTGLDDIDPQMRETIERTYFRRSLDEVWSLTREHHRRRGAVAELDLAERDPRHRMALVFRWYFAHSTLIALAGQVEEKVNFQVHCGPAMGAFNDAVAGTGLEPWTQRHVEVIAQTLMRSAAATLATVQEVRGERAERGERGDRGELRRTEQNAAPAAG